MRSPRSSVSAAALAAAALAPAAGALAALGGACTRPNPDYCPGAPYQNCALAIDSCESDADCTAGRPYCQLEAELPVCVECRSSADCEDPRAPRCAPDGACRGCDRDADCGGEACLPTGACSAGDDVAYVAPTGDDANDCTITAKCRTIPAALARGKAYVHVSGTLDGTVDLGGTTTARILGDDTGTLTKSGGGPVLVLSGTATVELHRLTVGYAADGGVNGPAILLELGATPSLAIVRSRVVGNAGRGVTVAGGALRVERSMIAENRGGGIEVQAGARTYDITNSFILANGSGAGTAPSDFGGVALLRDAEGARFEFNTVARNAVRAGSLFSPGVTCTGPLATASGNIVYANRRGSTGTDADQRAGSCVFGNTLFAGSHPTDLGFAAPNASPPDMHLTARSPAAVVDFAGRECPSVDFDGDPRPNGAACDLGADELYAPGP